jgi:hypothetical protein
MSFESPITTFLNGTSHSRDASVAVQELREQIYHEGMSVVVSFCSSNYDLYKLGQELKAAFPCPVLCCTTSGELGPNGYDEWSLTGFSISSPRLEVCPHLIENLSHFDPNQLSDLSADVNRQITSASERIPNAKTFGFLLIDGMSVMEEQVVGNLYALLNNIPIVGGSAGDDLKFDKTYVYFDGQFKSSAACFALFVTSLPFEIFKTQHFEPTDRKLVITSANPETRTVFTINGRPAVDEYARLIGMAPEDLNPDAFSANPFLLKIGGEYYVRSIQKANPDRSLSFLCAIDKGVVLTIGSGINILENLEQTLNDVEQRVNSNVIIGCECILRRLEVLQKDIRESAGRIMTRHHVIGFHTYGEQFNSVHVNQTFTGVAIGQ